MPANMNLWTGIGNLTSDIELQYTSTGKAVCDFTIAINKKYKDGNGEWQERTTFADIKAWGTNAENSAQYLKKGRLCAVEGEYAHESWEDQEGNKRRKSYFLAKRIQFLDREVKQAE